MAAPHPLLEVPVGHYAVCDGNAVIHLEPAEEGGFTVTVPGIPGLVTEAETIQEAFANARDAAEALAAGRARSGK